MQSIGCGVKLYSLTHSLTGISRCLWPPPPMYLAFHSFSNFSNVATSHHRQLSMPKRVIPKPNWILRSVSAPCSPSCHISFSSKYRPEWLSETDTTRKQETFVRRTECEIHLWSRWPRRREVDCWQDSAALQNDQRKRVCLPVARQTTVRRCRRLHTTNIHVWLTHYTDQLCGLTTVPSQATVTTYTFIWAGVHDCASQNRTHKDLCRTFTLYPTQSNKMLSTPTQQKVKQGLTLLLSRCCKPISHHCIALLSCSWRSQHLVAPFIT